jgi:hypothetical protein
MKSSAFSSLAANVLPVKHKASIAEIIKARFIGPSLRAEAGWRGRLRRFRLRHVCNTGKRDPSKSPLNMERTVVQNLE